MENKKAKIISAEKDKIAIVICPHCNNTEWVKVGSLEYVYEVKCECGEMYDIDSNDLMNQMHWVAELSAIIQISKK